MRVKEGKPANKRQRETEKELTVMDQRRDIDVDRTNTNVEEKHDSSLVASTFIKYFAYIVIFFGALYFLVRYVFPMF